MRSYFTYTFAKTLIGRQGNFGNAIFMNILNFRVRRCRVKRKKTLQFLKCTFLKIFFVNCDVFCSLDMSNVNVDWTQCVWWQDARSGSMRFLDGINNCWIFIDFEPLSPCHFALMKTQFSENTKGHVCHLLPLNMSEFPHALITCYYFRVKLSISYGEEL